MPKSSIAQRLWAHAYYTSYTTMMAKAKVPREGDEDPFRESFITKPPKTFASAARHYARLAHDAADAAIQGLVDADIDESNWPSPQAHPTSTFEAPTTPDPTAEPQKSDETRDSVPAKNAPQSIDGIFCVEVYPDGPRPKMHFGPGPEE